MGLLDDIRNHRRRVRTKAELLRGLRDAPLSGDLVTSQALGMSDPRVRSGPEGVSSTGQRYNPDQFWIDSDGRLNLRLRDILQQVDDLPDDGGPRVGGNRRFDLTWNFAINDQHNIADGFVGRMAGFNSLNDDTVYFTATLPSNMSLTLDFTLNFVMQVNVNANSFALSCDVYNTDPGTLTSKSADFAGTINGDASGKADNELFLESITVPASALSANTKAIWVVLQATTLNGSVDLYIPNAYGEFQ